MVLVTGANGQLGSELKLLAPASAFEFIFTDVEELDLTDGTAVRAFFGAQKIDFCINCAAYTAVDRAEEDEGLARAINAGAVENLAKACAVHEALLVHISTDFVFDGQTWRPLDERDRPNPVSVYGRTKLEGEQLALQKNPKTIIIRTSWLYSTFGNNFVKTMLRLGSERDSLGVIVDQVGTPTYAADLAAAILHIINELSANFDHEKTGIFHYSNEGVASWYDFAKAIFDLESIAIDLKPIGTDDYPTPARRPHYSVMDKSKIKQTFDIAIPYWRDSLKKCLKLMAD